MAKYIDADLFREKMVKFIAQEEKKSFQLDEYDIGWITGLEYAKDELYNAPTADVQEVKHGRWEWNNEDEFFYSCSNCGHKAYGNTNEIVSGLYAYCPNCGAKMDEVGE